MNQAKQSNSSKGTTHDRETLDGSFHSREEFFPIQIT